MLSRIVIAYSKTSSFREKFYKPDFPKFNTMKRGLVIGVVVVVIIAIALGIYYYPSGEEPEPTPTPSNCGTQGQTIFTPNECCEGLENVNTQDSVSVADECYYTGTASGAPILTCSDCGNGICEDVESVCGCSEDCVGKGKSAFNTVQDFCNNGYEQYCDRLPEGMELDLCNLCA